MSSRYSKIYREYYIIYYSLFYLFDLIVGDLLGLELAFELGIDVEARGHAVDALLQGRFQGYAEYEDGLLGEGHWLVVQLLDVCLLGWGWEVKLSQVYYQRNRLVAL